MIFSKPSFVSAIFTLIVASAMTFAVQASDVHHEIEDFSTSEPTTTRNRSWPMPLKPPSQLRVDQKLPEPLSLDDLAAYRIIFHQQRTGSMANFKQAVGSLNDETLLGYVLANHYLKQGKNASVPQLTSWLKRYIDHPQAGDIYRLAARLDRRAIANIPNPQPETTPLRRDHVGVVLVDYASTKKLSLNQRNLLRQYTYRIRKYLRRQNPTAALQVFQQKDLARLADAVELDALRSEVAAGLFYQGRIEKAYEMAAPAADRIYKHSPISDWVAGLAAWRLKKYNEAQKHFERLAVQPNISPWSTAGAAFWNARIFWQRGDVSGAEKWLKIAAEHPRTLYGIMAHRSLGRALPLNWDGPQMSQSMASDMVSHPAMRRALALIQLGELDLARKELRPLQQQPQWQTPLLLIAQALNDGHLSILTSLAIQQNGGEINDATFYPITRFQPRDGYQLDLSMIHAFIHQESYFRTDAVSHAGARGLMQLMPRTAQYISGGQNFRGANGIKLFDPEFNMMLGQRYLRYLMRKDEIQGNIVLLAAAYNGGVGNVRRWLKTHQSIDDPLLFMESIPLLETRLYVRRVLANLWIYQHRFNQKMLSLEHLMAGRWPTYSSQDDVRPPPHLTAPNASAPLPVVDASDIIVAPLP